MGTALIDVIQSESLDPKCLRSVRNTWSRAAEHNRSVCSQHGQSDSLDWAQETAENHATRSTRDLETTGAEL